ncbi:MAG: ATP-binding protein [Planctomycetes bacterium]|nr:ATP-binding protein [Planctomycetota bacterium]
MRTIETIQKLIRSYNNEKLDIELKTTDKFWVNNSFQSEILAKIISSLANRKGGSLYIGVHDDGSYEGKGVFNKFACGSKTGIDRFKEYIENACRDLISPQIFIEINYYSTETDEEIVEINIPTRKDIPFAIIKRKGNEIDGRKYFIRTNHGISRVSDKHLQWMFLNTNLPSLDNYYTISVTTYKNLGGIPFNIGNLEKVILQPSCTQHIGNYLRKIVNDSSENYKADKIQLLLEITLYSIFQTIEGTNRVVNDKEEMMPTEISHLLMSKYLKNPIEEIERFGNSALFPPGCRKSIVSEKHKVLMELENPYLKMTFTLNFSEFAVGLNARNPYSHIFVNMFGLEGQNKLHDTYDNYIFVGNLKVEYYYPEEFDENYYTSVDRANRIAELINAWWDIDKYMENYPHYRKSYEIDMKLDQIIMKLNAVKT